MDVHSKVPEAVDKLGEGMQDKFQSKVPEAVDKSGEDMWAEFLSMAVPLSPEAK